MVFSYIKGWIVSTENYTDFSRDINSKVSILVAARNEAENISACLSSLVSQNYLKECYEIILLDDFSEDKTLEIAKSFSEIKILELKDFLTVEYKNKPNKKRAISIGVAQAKYEVIITVDGDCIFKENWLKSKMQFHFKTQAKMISSPVMFFSGKSIWTQFLELDLTALMGITVADIKNNLPSMVNGANLLFEKEVFYEVGGFEGNEKIPSGDDVFLMQKIHAKFPKKIKFLKNKEAIAYTNAPNSFSEFVQQRIRWTSKSKKFASKKVRNTLILNVLFYMLLTLGIFILPFFNLFYLKLSLILFGLKLVVDFIFFKNLTHFFKNERLLKNFFLIELMHLPYISLLGLLSLVGKYTWKDRKV